MKSGSLLQFLGMWASPLTSIFAAHALMAKSDIKDLTKTSKKMLPVEKGYRYDNVLDWREADTEQSGAEPTRTAGMQNGRKTMAAQMRPDRSRRTAELFRTVSSLSKSFLRGAAIQRQDL
jgi:hypothetical protein